ncbi:MAG TPA: hypothetical protein DIV98_05545, partial [Oceanicaulis sp.]|nr:hypothetical protein [Oceanicaulis sp.]
TLLAVTIPNFPCGLPGLSLDPEAFRDPDEAEVRSELDRLIAFHSEAVLRGLGTRKLLSRLDEGETF